MTSFLTALRRRKHLLAPLRALHYQFWRATRVSGIAQITPELRDLARIVRRSPKGELDAPARGRRILIFTFRSWNTHAVADALLGHALRRRGADVRFFICGGRLPICDASTYKTSPPMPCNTCAPYVSRLIATLRLPFEEMRDFITPGERLDIERQIADLTPEQLEPFVFDDLPLGKLVRPSVQWFMLSGSPSFDREMQETFRRFLVSGAIMSRVGGRMLDRLNPEVVYMLNGIFFAERIVIEHARRRGIRFVTHEGGFMPSTQVFANDGFAPHHNVDDVWARYASHALTDDENRLLQKYLDDRTGGRRDVSQYYPSIESDSATVARTLDLDPGKPLVTLFTNVDWDTACFAAGSAFESMEHWLEHTIRYFAAHPERQLVIRVHPAEIRLRLLEPRVGVIEMVKRHFEQLPTNVRLVPPDSNLSSYALMELSSLGLVYTSTVGMEMALRGKPVISAGRGYYVNKGFTLDAQSPAEYDALLDRGHLVPLSPQQLELARRYASLFFFRHHIAFPFITSRDGRIHFNFDDLAALRPGRNQYLDLVCDGILEGRPFVYEGALE